MAIAAKRKQISSQILIILFKFLAKFNFEFLFNFGFLIQTCEKLLLNLDCLVF